MNWWLNFYFGEGPGIPKDAPKPVGLRRLGVTVAREWLGLLQLNLLFIVCALPLFTLPAAFSAMTGVLARMDADEPCEVWRDFWRIFATSALRATGLGLVFGGAIALSVNVLSFYGTAAQDGSLLFVVPFVIAIVALIFSCLAGCVALQLAGTTTTPLWTILRATGVAVIIRFLPLSGALVGNAVLWGLHVAAYPATVLMAILINFSLGALLMVFAAGDGPRTSLGYIENLDRARKSQRAPNPITEPQ
ncbi:MAG: DUF624 domain-containing protein [Hyphomicrobiales bacterium]